MERKDALAGVRVVDFSWIVAGPQATRILADFGAEVIRIENSQTIDTIRNAPPFADDEPGINRSGFWNNLNRSKLSITLNVRHPRGMELIKQLISISDVVIENFSSRVMENWGLPYEEMKRLKEDIIYVSVSGFGHSGRNRDYTTWGPTAQALSGLTFSSGLPGAAPAGWGYSYMDHTAGYSAAIAVISALHFRKRTGKGQYIDMSQVEAGIVLNGANILDYTVNGRRTRRPDFPPGNRSIHPAVAPHNTYRCRGEDQWCVISVFSDDEWEALCWAMGEPDWCQDEKFATMTGRVKNQDELDANIEEWTHRLDKREVMALLQSAGIAAGAVQTSLDRVENDPQIEEREFLPEMDHPEAGRYKYEGIPVKLSRTPGYLRNGGPLLGEHNNYVYGDLLGLSESEINELVQEGII
jgi:crotonobetainyl-CoA:carnitine CoA-transferase CaiB-like acyl-CoA transferase